MNDPVLLLDSTVLVAYERELTRRAQAVVMEALVDGRLLATTAMSLAVACAELGGETRELSWLVYDRESPLSVLPLSSNAMEVGALAASSSKTMHELEAAHVVHEAQTASAVVLSYDPNRYTGHHVDLIDIRP